MNASLATIIAAAFAVLVSAGASLASWLGIRHQHSGSVDSADAATIFKAAEELRTELHEEIETLRREVLELRFKLNQRDEHIAKLEDENKRKDLRISKLEAENTRLTARVGELETRLGAV